VIVDTGIDEIALADMDRRGAIGVRLNWVRRATVPDVTSPAYRALFGKVHALGWHVEIFLEGPKLADVLPRIRESGVNVVVDHFGAPDPALREADPGFREALKGIAARDTWVKLSAPYRLGGVDAQRYVDALLAAGPRQLVWASDWPFVSHEDDVTYDQCVGWLRTWVPDEPTRRMILIDTPAALFGFGNARDSVRAQATL